LYQRHGVTSNQGWARGIIACSIASKNRFMRSRFIRQLGSIIGLIAILMTAFAPAVSQAIYANSQARTVPAAYCSATSRDGINTRFNSDPLAGHDRASAHNHWDACGYCNFVAHSPGAPPSPNTKQPVSAPQTPRYSGSFESIAPYAPVVAAQPRAPPSFI
jgi:hypothetical protein